MLNLSKSSIKTGVKAIDEEHLKYFDILSTFLDKIDSNERTELFDELIDYVIYHFSHEEELMEKYNYPHVGAHKQQHRYFKDKIWELSNKYANNNLPIDMTTKMKINNLLFDWFVKHIQTIDKRLCQFIIEEQKHTPAITKILNHFLDLLKKSS